jgi:pimeloyl-ACP methyl ester carboxylesterase
MEQQWEMPRVIRPSIRGSFGSGTGLSVLSRPTTDSDPFGLMHVWFPDKPTADIIFVHGLGGSALRTWSWERKPTNFWPAWLAEDETLRDCRILTFGYNSNFKGDAHNLDIIDFAKDLCLQMLNCLDDGDTDRPIILIAHSMGGLVIKKAFMLGQQDDRYVALMRRVSGMIFLATPHRGSQYAKMLNHIISVAPIAAPPKAYVAALERQSPVLQDINETFAHQCQHLRLVSFYESLKTNMTFTRLIVSLRAPSDLSTEGMRAQLITKTQVVEKESAVLGYKNEISASMHADHNTICKYASNADGNFVKLRDTLKQMLPKGML